MSNKSDINPDITPTKPLPPFKMCMLNNFPFIDETFDALTNYELLCKVVEYCNKTGENTNIANENVVKLNDAFLELQEYVNESFDDLNVQTYVNNKIDEMILNGDFEELIINAINSVNPAILDESARVNVFDLPKRVLEYGVDSITYNSTFLDSDTDNKAKLIAIINDMKSKNHTKYYFINNLDVYVAQFKMELLTSTSLQIRPFFDATKLYLNIGDTYTNTLNFTLTIVDNVVTDITFDSESSLTYNILKNGNTNSYTPTNDYDPATKKFVLDNAGGSDAPITTIELVDGYYMNDMENNLSADIQLIGESLLDHYNNYGNRGFIYFKNPSNTQYPWQANVYTLFEFKELDTNSARFRISKPFINRPQDYKTANSDVLNYDFYYSNFNPLIMSSVSTAGIITKTLATDNDNYYIPQYAYNPATKDYVDTNVAMFGTGTFPYTASNDYTVLASSYYSFISKNDIPVSFDIQLNLTTTNSVSGDSVIASTPNGYAGFSNNDPVTNVSAWTGIAIVFNNSTDPIYCNVTATYNTSSQLWDLVMHIPTGTTITSGATINLHLNYSRAVL